MHIIPPIEIASTELTSTTVTDSTQTWLIGSSYDEDEEVQLDDIIYASAIAGIGTNTGNDPRTDSVSWAYVSATNPWKAFDELVGSQATGTTSIQYVIEPGQSITAIALFNITASDISIEFYDNTGTVIIETILVELISTVEVYDWYTYFFEPIDSVSNYSIIEETWAAYDDPRITITLTGTGTVGIGEIVIGTGVDLGATQKGPVISIIDYSGKTTDTFGNVTIVSRAFSKRANIKVITETANINTVSNAINNIRTSPVVWVALDDVEFASTLLIYGYLKDYNMTVANPLWADLSLQIEGLT